MTTIPARVSLAAAVLLLVLTGCSGTQQPATRQLQLRDCLVSGVSARCGSFPVPEDRAAGTGRTIRLRLAVLPATGGAPARDAVFWFAGGPGGSAIDDAPQARSVLAGVNLHRDVVLVDQRGTGGSNDLRCPAADDRRQWATDLRGCLPGLHADPGAYTTAWAADDLDDVRAALGYDEIDLYGASYGATAAQVYLQRHAQHVRSAILVAGTLLDVPVYERFPAASQHALDLVFARCAADPACSAAFPDPAGDLRAVTARLDAGPAPLTDPATGRTGQVTRDDFGPGVHGLLLNTETAAALPRLLHSAARGDWGDVLTGLSAVRDDAGDGGRPGLQLMELTIVCHEPQNRMRRDETDAASGGSYLRYDDVRALTVPEDVCAVTPAPPRAALYGPLTPVHVPVLFMNGEADPQDPPANVAAAARLFPDSVTIAVPNQGHHFAVTPCQVGIFTAFVERAAPTGWSADCLRDIPAPPFDLG